MVNVSLNVHVYYSFRFSLIIILVLILAVSIMPIIPSRRNHTPLLDARTRITNHNRREHIYLVIEHLLQGGEPHLLLWTIGIAD